MKRNEEDALKNAVLHYQDNALHSIKFPNLEEAESKIAESETLLTELGYTLPALSDIQQISSQPGGKNLISLPSWEALCEQAVQSVGTDCQLEDLFTPEELKNNRATLATFQKEFAAPHKLDGYDVGISILAGLIGAAVDILLVGIPKSTSDGLQAGPLSDWIRKKFNEKFTPEKIHELESSKGSKVPYDAQDNRNTTIDVDGLSTYYHRLLSLGHDPLLGFIVGVFDIMTGRMTTIDKSGKIVSQVMENYADRKEANIFAAIAKEFTHLKSDVTTSMGLPVPLMGLFNLLQFGSIGEEEQTIAEIVQGMYYEGYDFIHFCSMSIPVMTIEVITRLGYSVKRIKEGQSIKSSIPFSTNREKHPKLATMLFIAHSVSTAANAGKIWFSKEPMAINYSQWLSFIKYSYKQLMWVVIQKPHARDAFISGKLNDEFTDILTEIDESFLDISAHYTLLME